MPSSKTAELRASRGRQDSAIQYNERAWHRATHGVELDEALADADRSLALAPGDYHALDTRGYVLLQLGRVDSALSDFKASVAADSNPQRDLHPGENVYHLALALEHTGDRAGADSSFKRAIRFYYRPTYEAVLTPEAQRQKRLVKP